MVGIPTWAELGSGNSLPNSERGTVDGDIAGGQLRGQALKRFGGVVEGIGDSLDRGQQQADVLKADDIKTQADIALKKQFEDDPDYATYGERAKAGVEANTAAAASVIRSPEMRAKYEAHAKIQGYTTADQIDRQGKSLERQTAKVDLEDRLAAQQEDYGHDDHTDADRDGIQTAMESRIDAAVHTRQITPLEGQQLKKHYVDDGARASLADRRIINGDSAGVLKDYEDLKNSSVTVPADLTEAQKARGNFRTGSVSVVNGGDEKTIGTYGSGAGDRDPVHPSTPYGIYPLGPIRTTKLGAVVPLGKAGADEYSEGDFQNNQGFDPKTGRNRSQEEFHRAFNAEGRTKGCLSLSRAEYEKLLPEIKQIQKESGQAYVAVNPDGSVKIFGKGDSGEESIRQVFTEQKDATGNTKVADASGETVPGAPARKNPLSGISPQKLHSIVYQARTALSADTQAAIDADTTNLSNGQEPVKGDDGLTTLDRAEKNGWLLPNQIAKARIKQERARAEFGAIAPLTNMTGEEAEAHLQELKTSASPAVWKKADAEWKRIDTGRNNDPAKEASLDPQVQQVRALVAQRSTTLNVEADTDGNVKITPKDETSDKPFDPAEAEKARDMIYNARLQAQEKRGITEHSQKMITNQEAKELLDLTKEQAERLDTKAYAARLNAAAERAVQLYGPKWGERALSDAIDLRLGKGNEDTRKANTAILTKLAQGKDITPSDLYDYKQLMQADKVGRELDFSPVFEPPTSSTTTGMSGAPLSTAVEWLKANVNNPQAHAIFDGKYGAGASIAALAQTTNGERTSIGSPSDVTTADNTAPRPAKGKAQPAQIEPAKGFLSSLFSSN